MIPLLVKMNDVNLTHTTIQYTTIHYTLHTMLRKQGFHVAVYLDSNLTLFLNCITNKYNNQEMSYKLAIKTVEINSILFVLFWISFYIN
jgi:hypothetical protein